MDNRGRRQHDAVCRARASLTLLQQQLRDDIGELAEPSLKVLFVRTAELMAALDQALDDAEAHAVRTSWRTSA